jgi:nicotinate-nucleotide pyrophosphorylase (carboxylating)
MQPDIREIDRIIQLSLAEDIGRGDITSIITIPNNIETEFVIRARESMVVCGVEVAMRVFKTVSNDINVASGCNDGDAVQPGDKIITGQGNAQVILAAERVALNLLRQMCGVATLTHKFVQEVKGTKVKILDTRKTIPGLRSIQKYAVKTGGGYNHRFGLDDGILIKDNHISVCGGIKEALAKARQAAPSLTRIEVECDTLEQVQEAVDGGADIILLDNMDITTLKKAVAVVGGKIPLEASGNVNLKTVREIAETGVDFISAGMLTHSALSVDIGLDIDL